MPVQPMLEPVTCIAGAATSFSRSRTEVMYWSSRAWSPVLTLVANVVALSRTASSTLFWSARVWASAGLGMLVFVGAGAAAPTVVGAPADTSRSKTACGLTVLPMGMFAPDQDMLRAWTHGEPSQYESSVERPT